MQPAIHVGTAGNGPLARVDARGTVMLTSAAWHLEWGVGADDRWRVPANETAVRQHRVDDVAVVETAMRVPDGDAVQRVYGVAGPGNPVVVEVENRSPAPFVVALVVRHATRVNPAGRAGRTVVVDRAFCLTTPRAPARWARATGRPVLLPVATGATEAGPVPGAYDRSARLEVALLHPVAHRGVLRAVLTAGKGVAPADPGAMPDAATAVRGWSRLLDRGMQAMLPDYRLAARLRSARSEVLLRARSRSPGAAVFAALEDWGFDDEARSVWRRLPGRERRRAATRQRPGTWSDVAACADEADFLVAVRRLLVDDRDPASVALCREWPPGWDGQPLEVRAAPLAGGPLSFAVRWHGTRPAIIWDAPPGVVLRAPGLDPTWCTTERDGEALLCARAPGAA